MFFYGGTALCCQQFWVLHDVTEIYIQLLLDLRQYF